ncbi:hypothetical protein ASPSYDRAFT_48751 [Aspergillus sydowii CBS 593.65]|uniref:WAP domain-containing protein n=1 Tax=Aspergillus sydowii CBS 593.65 TaxID=1036612 RepID=A0A1L9T7W6_9EURO|nr:uncharacterized protein ASPSYDRAFT_48751 [Aspergillus sydowii CBS 593.65]OJJ55540.1 hypothetical protein ASPSYDRAFT_48751 [Aspergillus sydowii CBS 593.65]
MLLSKPLAAVLIQLAATYATSTASGGCGDADACIGTEHCVTKTFTTPVSTVVTTCVPTPTCIGVYGSCDSGGSGPMCCSTYCAATKCRSTDNDWPNCSEDMGPCIADENCCYKNKCVEGLCVRPSSCFPPGH